MERLIKVLEHQKQFPQYYLRIIWRGGRSKSVRLAGLGQAYERMAVECKRHGGIGEYVIYKQSLEPDDIPGAAREEVRFFTQFAQRFKYGGEVLFEDYFPESAEAHECLRQWEKEMPDGHGAVYSSVAYWKGKGV